MDELSPSAAQHQLEQLLDPVTDSWRLRFYRRVGKRALDIAVACVAVVVLSPLIAVVAIVVRVRLGSPVLFSQRRLGLHAEVFEIRKFRTMLPDRRTGDPVPVEHERRSAIPSASDPRLTPVGRWLSARSLDELPQLIHVIRGEMSLVGPRPDYAHRDADYVGEERQRFAVRPGITGPWQVIVGTSTDLHAYVGLDVLYAERYSMGNDFRLIASTPTALFRRARHNASPAAAAAAGPR